MEVGVRVVGVILRLLNWILAPLYWLADKSRNTALPPIHPEDENLILRSTSQLTRDIHQGEVTSEHIVKVFIRRIQAVNPLLNAVVEERFNTAIEEAQRADLLLQEKRKAGAEDLEELIRQKPLLGVPFTVKESCSLTGLSNSVGCLEWNGRRAATDGGAVRLVRLAGAIPLLVSNTPELCLGWETTNLLNGTTCNPYCHTRTAGGSSGGEAALVASAATPFSIASDIAGSIRIPAAFNGVFGHKPTPGIVPIDGHIPTLNDEKYPKFLTIGPIVRCSEDLIPLLKVMAGSNAAQLRLDEPFDITKTKIYYMTEAGYSIALISVDRNIKSMLKRAVKYLSEECGAQVMEEKFEELVDSVEISVSTFFGMKDIPNLLQDPVNLKREHSLLIETLRCIFGLGTRSLQALAFAFIHRTNVFMSKSLRPHYEERAKKLRQHMKQTLGTDGVFLYPVFVGPAHEHHRVFTKASGVIYTMIFNILGMPATVVPLGLCDNLPIAIQVVAAPKQDRLCLAVARQLEIGFGGWRQPHTI